jgi:phosphoglycolate phosphatase
MSDLAGHIFMDLDGTMTDPYEGITKSIFYAMEKMGTPLSPVTDLGWAIGPSLRGSFLSLGVYDDDLERALGYYRERYTDIGLFENKAYDGIADEMKSLKARGYQLHMATAKPHSYARKITAYFGLSQFMTYEFGSELDGTNTDKADLLKSALIKLSIDPKDAVMVGDRKFDILGARANGVATIGVLWGYGSRAELEEAGADLIIEQIDQLSGAVTTLLSA